MVNNKHTERLIFVHVFRIAPVTSLYIDWSFCSIRLQC